MKGYLDTIPTRARGGGDRRRRRQFQIFRHVILPLATPVLAVTGVLRLRRRLDRVH